MRFRQPSNELRQKRQRGNEAEDDCGIEGDGQREPIGRYAIQGRAKENDENFREHVVIQHRVDCCAETSQQIKTGSYYCKRESQWLIPLLASSTLIVLLWPHAQSRSLTHIHYDPANNDLPFSFREHSQGYGQKAEPNLSTGKCLNCPCRSRNLLTNSAYSLSRAANANFGDGCERGGTPSKRPSSF